MARGRMITRRIGKSKKIAKLKTDMARFMYIILYTHTDCEGRCTANPENIREDFIGIKLIGKYTEIRIAKSIIDLADVKLITLYEYEKKPYLQVIEFDKNQPGLRKDREAPSEIPSPQEVGITPESSGITPSLYLKLKLNISNENKKDNKHIYFDFDKKKFLNVEDEDIQIWKDAYPKCNMKLELNKMRAWLIADPKRRKKNYKRFINNWLSRTQDFGGTKGVNGKMSSVEFNKMHQDALKK